MEVSLDEGGTTVLMHGLARQRKVFQATLALHLPATAHLEVSDSVFLENLAPALVRTCDGHVSAVQYQMLQDGLVGGDAECIAIRERALLDFD